MSNEHGGKDPSIPVLALQVGGEIDRAWREIVAEASFQQFWGTSFNLHKTRPEGCGVSLSYRNFSGDEKKPEVNIADLIFYHSTSGLPVKRFTVFPGLSYAGQRDKERIREITVYKYRVIKHSHPDFEEPLEAPEVTLQTFRVNKSCRRTRKTGLVTVVFGTRGEWPDNRVPRRFDPVLQESLYKPVRVEGPGSLALLSDWIESTRLVFRRDGNCDLYIRDETGNMRRSINSTAIGYEPGGEIIGPASVVKF